MGKVLRKKAKRDKRKDRDYEIVSKETGLTVIELKMLLLKGATSEEIMMAACIKKNRLGTIKT